MRSSLAVLASALLACPLITHAQDVAGEPRDGWSEWEFKLGGIQLDADPRVGIRIQDRASALVDFSNLGINDRDTSYWLRGEWRFGELWSVSFTAYSYDKSATRSIDTEIEFGDTVFPINATLTSRLSTDIYAIDVNRSFIRTPNTDIGMGLGVHFVDLAVGINAVGNAGETSRDLAERAAFLAPLPNLMGYANFKFSDRWRWNNRLGWFGLDIDEYNGDFVTFFSSIEFEFTDRFAVGAGYSLVDLDLDIDGRRKTEIYRIDYDGPLAFLSLRF